MTEHTPGPWEWLNLGFGFELIGNNGRPVIDCDCRIEAPGDFTLLAAAPDLLAACEALLESNLQLQRAVHGGLRNGPAEDMAVAAVAKARGEVTP